MTWRHFALIVGLVALLGGSAADAGQTADGTVKITQQIGRGRNRTHVG